MEFFNLHQIHLICGFDWEIEWMEWLMRQLRPSASFRFSDASAALPFSSSFFSSLAGEKRNGREKGRVDERFSFVSSFHSFHFQFQRIPWKQREEVKTGWLGGSSLLWASCRGARSAHNPPQEELHSPSQPSHYAAAANNPTIQKKMIFFFIVCLPWAAQLSLFNLFSINLPIRKRRLMEEKKRVEQRHHHFFHSTNSSINKSMSLFHFRSDGITVIIYFHSIISFHKWNELTKRK